MRHPARPVFGLVVGILLWPLAAMAEPAVDATIAVNVDQAKLLKQAS